MKPLWGWGDNMFVGGLVPEIDLLQRMGLLLPAICSGLGMESPAGMEYLKMGMITFGEARLPKTWITTTKESRNALNCDIKVERTSPSATAMWKLRR